MGEIDDYIRHCQEEAAKGQTGVRDLRVFDLSYVPEKPLIREEARRIIDALVKYSATGIPRNLVVIGSRGSGKTVMMHYLATTLSQQTGLSFHSANCRIHNTSFKVLASILNMRPRGYAFSELSEVFEKGIQGPAVIVLDEADLLAEKGLRNDVLYFLSRSPRRYSVVLLSNNPRFLKGLDESTRSSLQPDVLYFRNYSANEILTILQDRAAVGLESVKSGVLEEIAAMTARNTNSDVRVALKTLLYVVTNEAESVIRCFDQARHDIVLDMVNGLNDKALLIMKAACEEPSRLVKAVYERYIQLSRAKGEEPYSYVYFYNTLAYLQSVGLIMLVSAKINRAYTNRIEPLTGLDVLAPVLATRFQ